MTVEKDAECWLSDGRKAYYAGEIDGQHFVRLALHDGEIGEFPSDGLTAVAKAFKTEPTPIYGPQAEAAAARLDEVNAARVEARGALARLKAEIAELEAARAKYPEIQTAIDFFEGRITHVVEECAWDCPRVIPLQKFLENTGSYGNFTGLRLIGLFGTDAKGKTTNWMGNHYKDGSGSNVYFTPFLSEADAQAHVQQLAAAAFALWREGKEQLHVATRFAEAGVTIPDDIAAAAKAEEAKAKAAKIAKLRAELADLEE